MWRVTLFLLTGAEKLSEYSQSWITYRFNYYYYGFLTLLLRMPHTIITMDAPHYYCYGCPTPLPWKNRPVMPPHCYYYGEADQKRIESVMETTV